MYNQTAITSLFSTKGYPAGFAVKSSSRRPAYAEKNFLDHISRVGTGRGPHAAAQDFSGSDDSDWRFQLVAGLSQ
jgi:hypothetical protein